jgi:hypothetical protein
MVSSTRPPSVAYPRSVPSIASTKQPPVPLAKRLLSPSEPLPPLLLTTQIPDLSNELYHLIALSLRAFVNPWWTKITRYDKQFLPEINHSISFVIRSLEARLIATDLSPLLFHHIPVLITQHYQDFRNASSKLPSSYASGGSTPLPALFHQIQSHMAIDPEGNIDQVYIRHVVDHILKSCLPPEDYAPESQRFIVREIVVKVLLKDVVPKITEPWFLYKLALEVLGPPADDSSPTKVPTHTTSTFSFHTSTILVFFLSAIQSISGTCLALIHAYKQARSTIIAVNHTPTPRSHPPPDLDPLTPLETSPYASPSSSTSSLSILPQPLKRPQNEPDSDTQDYAHPILAMISEIFTLQDRFASTAIINCVYLLCALFAPFLDRCDPPSLPFLLT